MNPNEVVGLSMFLQAREDGSQFVSCEGQIGEQHVSFTVNDVQVLSPILTGVIVPVGDKGNRWLLEKKPTGGVELVGLKPATDAEGNAVVKEVQGTPVHAVKFSRLALITAPVAPVMAFTVRAAATRKAPQAPAC